MPIHFYSQDTKFVLKKKRIISTWLNSAATKEGNQIIELSYIFCSDDYLHKINIEYLNHDSLTDVITFPYEIEGGIKSDIFISYDRCKDNSHEFKVAISHEIHRVMIHGLLHLLGYNDKNKTDKSIMTSKEDYYLSLLPENIHL
ncbi:MAG: rRNA maturation RNase YbeY [Bacteroidetes bacterium CG2_30_33_31]|nr:MAG: rRNA maturation RNase YbeY [Bacteroidetes bacterium CG2_30_33_31]